MSFFRRLPHLVCVAAVFIASLAHADDGSFVVRDIRLEGLARLSAASVYGSLPINAGDTVDAQRIADAVKTLFKTGNFEDVQVGRDGDVLVLQLTERPTIVSIDITGNKSLEKDNLLKGLKSAGLAEGEVFQRATLDHVKSELERQYISQGRYAARIDVEATPKPRNRVGLSIKIKEGPASKIRRIGFVGNKVFDDESLRDVFQLKASHFTSFFKGDDKYSREKLSGDLERLQSWYKDRGYVNFTVNSTQVKLSPDKKDVSVDVSLSEGDQFRIGEVKLAGELPVPEDVLKRLVLVRKGDIFSQTNLTQTSKLITRRLGNDGYIFAEVNAIPELHSDTRVADVTFFVNPIRQAYVRRINFSGNQKTDDNVLRREMRQYEGALASSEKIDLSKLRLQRLGFFEDVAVDTARVPGASDQVDLNVAVKEQPSGSISASIGYSQGAGVIFSASVSQTNFLGTGNRFSLGLSRSEVVDSYNLSFVDPYFTLNEVSRGYNFYYKATKLDALNVSTYTTDSQGANISFGYPIDETERLSFALGVDETSITLGAGGLASQYVSNFVTAQGSDYLTYTGSLAWNRNTLNRGVFADRGASQSLSLDFAWPGSDLTYYRVNYNNQLYIPISGPWVGRLHGSLGYGDGYGDSDLLPFYKNYFAGGFGSVRGYRDNRMGPRSCAIAFCPNDPDPEVVGGNVLIEGGAELIVPTPFAANNRQVRTVLFLDAGNVFDTNISGYYPEMGDLRYTAGISLSWLTAIGPLSFSLARPLNKQPGDETRVFQFTIGQGF
ncbi:MAG: outer membrane protein assembly factor YaeT precursor [Moraxellaceae bacterium]|jgi:outer membrane protein insertion porin family|nr:outer membrane protein assembly factor YaeT precursor [Moraxellaceae bacterium]